MIGILLAVVLLETQKGGVALSVERTDSDARVIDPGRSVILSVTLTHPQGVKAALPDFRDRVRGFSLAEDFADEPETAKDGRLVERAEWRLVPEPCADVYKIAPFVAGDAVAGPIYFDNPPPREPVTGGMEVVAKKDLPPLSWRLLGVLGAWCLALGAVGAAAWWLVRALARKVKEHRMSPIERAWVELDRLLKKGLPGRGRYKDFYVELTMVVRRYVQRKYGIKAPHLTTEEFLREVAGDASRVSGLASNVRSLGKFLESADMVKFAGVEATPEMADDATAGAKAYLSEDDRREAAS